MLYFLFSIDTFFNLLLFAHCNNYFEFWLCYCVWIMNLGDECDGSKYSIIGSSVSLNVTLNSLISLVSFAPCRKYQNFDCNAEFVYGYRQWTSDSSKDWIFLRTHLFESNIDSSKISFICALWTLSSLWFYIFVNGCYGYI